MHTKAIGIWFGVFGINCAFQWWRGSKHDLYYFTGVLLLLALSLLIGESQLGRWPARLTRISVAGLALGVATVLALADLFSLANQLMLWVLVPLLLATLWTKRPEVQVTTALRRSAALWTTLALFLGVWELANYVLAQGPGGDAQFPTVSVLLDPVLLQNPGRAVVSALWVLAGIGLIQGRRVR